MPKVIPCGRRDRAYRGFRTSLASADPDELPMLLVDSEAPVTKPPWEHLKSRDGWERPWAATRFLIQLV
jgi:hypothetical protein